MVHAVRVPWQQRHCSLNAPAIHTQDWRAAWKGLARAGRGTQGGHANAGQLPHLSTHRVAFGAWKAFFARVALQEEAGRSVSPQHLREPPLGGQIPLWGFGQAPPIPWSLPGKPGQGLLPRDTVHSAPQRAHSPVPPPDPGQRHRRTSWGVYDLHKGCSALVPLLLLTGGLPGTAEVEAKRDTHRGAIGARHSWKAGFPSGALEETEDHIGCRRPGCPPRG